MKKIITNKQVEEWLGDYKSFDESIDITQEIANGKYSVEALRSDVLEYFDEIEDEPLRVSNAITLLREMLTWSKRIGSDEISEIAKVIRLLLTTKEKV